MSAPDRGDIFTDTLLALPFVDTWEDTGLSPIHYYRVFGKCSEHGTIQAVWDAQPMDNEKIVCGQHHDVIRACPIFAFTESARPGE